MRKLLGSSVIVALVFSISLGVSAAEEAEAASTPTFARDEVPALNSEREKASYIIGQNIASSIAPFKDKLDLEQFIIGLKESFSNSEGDPIKLGYAFGRQKGTELLQIKAEIDQAFVMQGVLNKLDEMESPLSQEEVKAIMTSFSEKVQAKREAEFKAFVEKNKADGEAFLETNKAKEGVKTTWSGLQYEVLQEGKGEMPKSTDLVQLNFKNQLIDGTEINSGQTPLRAANQAIPGWTEAMMMMNKGSKYRVFIPSDMAYGERGLGNVIPPNTVLISELEIVDIQPNPEAEKE
ncbi:MAG: FKBP-type peptidyl-prolyl cis-trans isomerase [Planctomycetes bacterium]|nr:FKBP-type peptidyl-prolyl cis-trans isomerase [Planctomycetota bacterium]